MRRSFQYSVAVVFLLICAFSVLRFVDSVDLDYFYDRLANRNPSGIVFELRLLKEKNHYRVGETIPIELRFSSSVPDSYELQFSTYDRSGRMPYEKFEI